MAKLTLTFANHGSEWCAYLEESLQSFAREQHFTVESKTFEWHAVWKELVDISVHRSGIDASEVGSTWVASLASMNSLRPFRPADINACGGVQAFLPSAWQSASVWGSQQVWALPFMSDVRVIYYWPDMLRKAGVDESKAFESFDAMRNTLERLKALVPAPLLMQTQTGNHGVVYQAATWLWAAGCDFASADGKTTLLERPEAHEALREHFELARYLPQERAGIDIAVWKETFLQRSAAVVISGPWFATELFRPTPLPDRLEGLGVACLPGPAFVGGACLIAWNHSYQEENIVALLRHLVSPQVQLAISAATGNLPASREAIDIMALKGRVQIQVFIDALKAGRPLPAIPLWGLTEQRLSETFARVWSELSESPEADVRAVLEKRLPPLIRRLNIILAG
ncbi:MAG: extracellular solute-binding protein [Chloroflexota bacterium]